MPPSVLGAAYPPAQGLVETSVGRYFSRAVVARLQAPLSDQASFLLRTDYRGSDGHEPFDDNPDLNAPFDVFEGLIGVQQAGTRWAAGFTFSGFYESYDLYGAGPVPSASILPYLAQPDREGRGAVGTLHLTTLADTPVEARLDLSYGATRYETLILPVDIDPEGLIELSEQRFEANTDVSFPVEAGDVRIAGAVSAASLTDGLGTY